MGQNAIHCVGPVAYVSVPLVAGGMAYAMSPPTSNPTTDDDENDDD